MTETAEAVAPELRQPPVDQQAAKLRRALSARAKAALLADLRDLWRDCNEIMVVCESVGASLKQDHITPLQALEQLGPDFVVWMIQIGRSRREHDGG